MAKISELEHDSMVDGHKPGKPKQPTNGKDERKPNWRDPIKKAKADNGEKGQPWMDIENPVIWEGEI